ncbi:12703_t:CDS:2 [Ambispora leptoticha]|uniref:12703_t:CDS:1 n=1 Tax=Ambispora leptoticha TaxID=144679 RepID=A0A9N9D7A8_9GLOM|nr:12703_t:CDS:2 [Ambispora leptoticha]
MSTQVVKITAENVNWKDMVSSEKCQSSTFTDMLTQSVALRQHYREFKVASKMGDRDIYSKITQEAESLLKTEAKEESRAEEPMNIEIVNEQKINDVSSNIVEEIKNSQKEAEQVTTFSEAELTS